MIKNETTLKSLYNQELKPHLEKLDKDRKHIIVQIIKWIPFTVMTWVATLAIIMVEEEYLSLIHI